MNKISVPELSICYSELKCFSICFGPGDDDKVILAAPDSHIAISAFTALWPNRDIANVVCVGNCISLSPAL